MGKIFACRRAQFSLRRGSSESPVSDGEADNADELIYERLAPVGRCPSPRSGSVRSAQAAKPNTLLRHVPPAQGCCRGAVDGYVMEPLVVLIAGWRWARCSGR